MSLRESDRITDALRYVAAAMSVDRDRFYRDQHPGGAALLEGCVSLGYVQRGKLRDNCDRFGLSDAGHRRLQAVGALVEA